MKHELIIKMLFCVALTCGAFVSNAHAQQGKVDINGSIGSGKLQKGKAATGTIVMEIPGGIHVNSARPLSQYAIPTSIKLTGGGLKLGAVSYPKGSVKKFSFSEEQIAVYEGRAVFRFNITVPATFKGDVAKIRAVVNYQSCSDEVCYRPQTGEVTLSAAVR